MIYEATPEGLERFEDWMATGSSMSPLREELHLKLALSQPRNLPRLIELTYEQEQACLERLEQHLGGASFDDLLVVDSPLVRRRERDGARRRDRPPAGDGRVAAPHPRGDALAAGAAGGAALARLTMTLLSLDGVTKRYRPRLPRGGGARRRRRSTSSPATSSRSGARSRSGKTTLLRVAAGIEAPDAGTRRVRRPGPRDALARAHARGCC